MGLIARTPVLQGIGLDDTACLGKLMRVGKETWKGWGEDAGEGER